MFLTEKTPSWNRKKNISSPITVSVFQRSNPRPHIARQTPQLIHLNLTIESSEQNLLTSSRSCPFPVIVAKRTMSVVATKFGSIGRLDGSRSRSNNNRFPTARF
jgi:hypothetical protein